MPKPPIEMDLPRIEEAIRRLAVLAWENSAPHVGPDGHWIAGQAKTDMGHLIEHPVLVACRLAHAQIHAYLGRTIGPAAAADITARINAETGAKFEAHEVAANTAQVRH